MLWLVIRGARPLAAAERPLALTPDG